MHTAYDIKADMFQIRLDGVPIERDALLDWDVRDRLGIVINAPAGALGAGLLTLLAITAFYDSPGRRRRMKPIYPDIFLFHRGGPWGLHAALDFFPDHKEVFVTPDPAELLRQINNRGITHLVVPDCARQTTAHRFKEPEAARDRIKRCFAYVPTGNAPNADIEIEIDDMSLLGSFDAVLNPGAVLARMRDPDSGRVPTRLTLTPPDEVARSIEILSLRAGELDPSDPSYRAVHARIEAARVKGAMVEALRRISVDDALEMLGPGGER